MADSYFWRISDSDSSNILKGFLKKLKKLSAAYVLYVPVLKVLYNSLPRIEPDFKRFYVHIMMIIFAFKKGELKEKNLRR